MKTQEYIWQSVHVIDVIQTSQIAKNPHCLQESGPAEPLIGKAPNEKGVYIWGIGSAVAHYFTYKFIKSVLGKHSKKVIIADNIYQLKVVHKNYRNGLLLNRLSKDRQNYCNLVKQYQSTVTVKF